MHTSPSTILRPLRSLSSSKVRASTLFVRQQTATFHSSPARLVVKPYLLADIGEGITECQIIQWFVQEGAKVAQFDRICEVQSDKASVEITSRFDGVIKKLHYKTDDVAQVGKPLVDIDIEGDLSPQDDKLTTPSETVAESSPELANDIQVEQTVHKKFIPKSETTKPRSSNTSGTHDTLATPAVRHLSKELDINITEVTGSGKDGRVTKEDLQNYASTRASGDAHEISTNQTRSSASDKQITITGIKGQMFKAMTRSLSIPHFLYTSPIDLTSLSLMRSRIQEQSNQKLTPLPFIIKAVSLVLQEYPTLNAHLDTNIIEKPILTQKAAHNFGVAIDSPHGLVVPVLHNVQDLSVSEISSRIRDLAIRARENKLAPKDLSGATFTISNIGSIGGGAVAPVISAPQVAILGIGRARAVAVWDDKENRPVRKEECIFSWSADHRVVDGAAVARAGEKVKKLLEEVGRMILDLR